MRKSKTKLGEKPSTTKSLPKHKLQRAVILTTSKLAAASSRAPVRYLHPHIAVGKDTHEVVLFPRRFWPGETPVKVAHQLDRWVQS
jgi:hypothetical protein